MKRIILVLAAALTLCGCVAEYQVKDLAGTQSTATLNPQDGVYIALPADGAYGPQSYPGSGQTVAQSFAAAFSQFAQHVHTATAVTGDADDFADAAKYGDRYIVVPVITHWEPRDTAWSGRRSKMALRVTVFDAVSRQQLSSVALEGKSAQQTLASTSPEQLLNEPVEKYVASLYRRP
jgi:hypothetical protein